jgi:hypothetical protein
LEIITKFSHPRVRGHGDPVSRHSQAVQQDGKFWR